MKKKNALRILHLEDDPIDAEFIQRALARAGLVKTMRIATSRAEFVSALDSGGFDVILSDNALAGIDGRSALLMARERYPDIPFLFVSGHVGNAHNVKRLISEGALDCISKSDLPKLVARVQRITPHVEKTRRDSDRLRTELLVSVVQELSLARDLETVMQIVRRAS
jgi:CheY-like chemotaxis protein